MRSHHCGDTAHHTKSISPLEPLISAKHLLETVILTSGIRHRANDQRLCLPRIPAFVRCFNMEDLLNTLSRVICSSFVSLE